MYGEHSVCWYGVFVLAHSSMVHFEYTNGIEMTNKSIHTFISNEQCAPFMHAQPDFVYLRKLIHRILKINVRFDFGCFFYSTTSRSLCKTKQNKQNETKRQQKHHRTILNSKKVMQWQIKRVTLSPSIKCHIQWQWGAIACIIMFERLFLALCLKVECFQHAKYGRTTCVRACMRACWSIVIYY